LETVPTGRTARFLHQMTSGPGHQFWDEIPGALADPDLLQALSSAATHG
jgi:hypothetical protein